MDALLTLSRPSYNKLQDYKMTKIMVMSSDRRLDRDITAVFKSDSSIIFGSMLGASFL